MTIEASVTRANPMGRLHTTPRVVVNATAIPLNAPEPPVEVDERKGC
jgi:hypothetical protein